MTKLSIAGLFCCLFSSLSSAQSAHWQQRVDYRIDVVLNDQLHQLQGQVEWIYHHRGPRPLDTIYFHLWGNAFQGPNTAFARQQFRQGNSEFYFADASEQGGYSGLDFRVEDRQAEWGLLPDNPDMGWLHLPRPLESGDSLHIRSPFTLRIPASFSRLGHIGESYQLTQWYPKPAALDQRGWHWMPYLDQGEFFADFGSFEVQISLPENYVVAATGVLETPEEEAFLAQRIDSTNRYLSLKPLPDCDAYDFPPSSLRLKTLRYRAEQVHDFAWFADKRFLVQKSKVQQTSGPPVDTWVFFTCDEQELWREAIRYVNLSLAFFSEHIGTYPYPQATAVQSALSAGAGMEYPMITVIGLSGSAEALDEVIAHEVAHNWFYGVLAFEERRHPWMDEGLTSYYEQRYMRQYHPGLFYPSPLNFRANRRGLSAADERYLFQARRHRDQAPNTPSEEFTPINYLIGAYEKPAKTFYYLENWLGLTEFDRLMQGFYQTWKFRHPYPEDLQQYLEQQSGKKLDWFFEGMMGSARAMDYAIRQVKQDSSGDYRIWLKNKGAIAAPIPLAGFRGDSLAALSWIEGFHGDTLVEFPAGSYDRFFLDPLWLAPELYRHNNRWRLNRLFPRIEPLGPSREEDRYTGLFVTPALAWNAYDKFMLGAAFFTPPLPGRRVEWALAPMYSFGAEALAGTGRLAWRLYPGRQALTLSAGARRFHFRDNAEFDYQLRYDRLQLAAVLELAKSPAASFFQQVSLRGLLLRQQTASFDDGNFTGLSADDSFIQELAYQGENRRAIHPFELRAALEHQRYREFGRQEGYLRLSLEGQYHFTYQHRKHIDFRLFGGFFPWNSRRRGGRIFPGAFNLIAQGYNDYRFDESYLGRTENIGFWSQQISLREGAFKTPLGSGFGLGRSNNFILALNVKADLPFDLPLQIPLKPYFDFGYFDNAQPTGQNDQFQDQLLWNGGLALDFFDGLFGFYLPLVSSKNLRDRLQERGNLWSRAGFSIDFGRLNPFAAIHRGRL